MSYLFTYHDSSFLNILSYLSRALEESFGLTMTALNLSGFIPDFPLPTPGMFEVKFNFPLFSYIPLTSTDPLHPLP